MVIRVIQNPHRSYQRLSFLKYLVYKTSLNDSTPSKTLGEDLFKAISRKVCVTVNNSVREYVKHRLRKVRIPETGTMHLELQDAYLSDPLIPSKTGKLYYDDCIRRFPNFLSSIGLARPLSNSLLVRGKVFLKLIRREELQSFTNYTQHLNPLVLTEAQKYLFLFSLIEHDGDVLKLLYPHLLKLEKFSDWEAGDFLPDIYRYIAKQYSSKASTGFEKQKIGNLLESAKKIEAWGKKPRTGGRGAKLDAITPRIEPYVDLGFLTKTSPFKYEYFISSFGLIFFTSLTESKTVDSFLNYRFFTTLDKAFNLNATPLDQQKTIPILINSYHKIKSPLGYAPIKEVALMGAVESLAKNNSYYEVGKAKEWLLDYYRSHPYDLRFQVDRSGAPVYVKILKQLY